MSTISGRYFFNISIRCLKVVVCLDESLHAAKKKQIVLPGKDSRALGGLKGRQAVLALYE